MASVRVSDLHKWFGKENVLRGISMEVREGEFLVLVGPSGCGKSTLLNLIAGLEEVSQGEIFIGERSVIGVPPKDRNIAMVFQSYALYPTMTVWDNIAFGLQMRNVPRALQKERVQAVAHMLQIEALLKRKPSQLSGGQRQRVAMGRALARDPDVFLFDEPLSNLDAKLRVEMRAEIKRLHKTMGRTAIYVTHDQVEAMTLADRIAVMKDGQVFQQDVPRAIYEKPANLFVAGFIGSPSMNFLPAELKVNPGGVEAHVPHEPGGPPLAIPIADPEGRYRGMAGRHVTLGIRPEHITQFEESADVGARAFTFEARVYFVEPTGPDTLVFMDIGETHTIARVRPDAAAPEGERMRFRGDSEQVLVFDPDSGQRL